MYFSNEITSQQKLQLSNSPLYYTSVLILNLFSFPHLGKRESAQYKMCPARSRTIKQLFVHRLFYFCKNLFHFYVTVTHKI